MLKSTSQRDEASAEDGIGELLRLAESTSGMSTEISSDRLARHKALARQHWEASVERRRRRLWTLGVAAAALVALAAGWLGMMQPWAESETLEKAPIVVDLDHRRESARPAGDVVPVKVIAGTVESRGGAASQVTLVAGATVAVGTLLETDTVNHAAMTLASGHELRLDVDTRVRLISREILSLERGAVYVDSHHSPVPLEIRTQLGIARDIGTRFEIRLRDNLLRVRVRDGVVEVDRSGQVHQAQAGAEITIESSGAVRRGEVPVFGSEWAWSLRAAPVFEVQGRTLREFLDWVARETAWQLRIDPRVAAGIAHVIVEGSSRGLTPEEALEVVLPTSGLRHRIDDGVLSIEPILAPVAVR